MTHMYQILVIEDEEYILDFIVKNLSVQGYKVLCAKTGTEGLSLITSHCPDVILLDLGLPDIDGLEIIQKVRSFSKNPIIVVSARVHENDKVHCLDAGADDYITKPFSPSELSARIRTAIRHSISSGAAEDALACGQSLFYQSQGLSIDFAKRHVTLDGRDVHLTPVEYKIVFLLAKNPGRVLTHTAIMQEIWGPYIDEDTKILRVNMANIRRKLEQNPADPKYIFTEIGVGYRIAENTRC